MALPALKIITSVTLDGTETIKWTDSGGAKSVTVDAGTYWLHNDSTFTDYPGLLDHVLTKMNAAAAPGYVFNYGVATPTLSGSGHNFGLRMYTTDPGVSWTWDASGTINTGQWLGWQTTDGTTASASGSVTSKRMHRGVWRSPEAPSDYTAYPEQIITPSTEYVERTKRDP